VTRKPAKPESNIDPNLPSWVRQEAEFSGALGRAARGKRPAAIVAWILIGMMAVSLILGWIVQLFR
jgi:hypothetical protein